jgi:hypothetical protein
MVSVCTGHSLYPEKYKAILSHLRLFYLFIRLTKAKPQYNTIYSIGGLYMRKPRILEALSWYWVITAINRHEPLFLDRAAVDLFNRVLREAGKRFAIEVRRLVIQADREKKGRSEAWRPNHTGCPQAWFLTEPTGTM